MRITTEGNQSKPLEDNARLVAGLTAAGLPVALAVGADGGLAKAKGTLGASTAYEASHIIKASAGALLSLTGYNSKASAQFIQIHDSATVPADTAVPKLTFTVPGLRNFSLDIPLALASGIVVCNSSTGPTKTIGSADCFFSFTFE